MGCVAIKIDLEKAYDKLKWSFIRDTLHQVNLLKSIVEVIVSYATTATTSILFKRGSFIRDTLHRVNLLKIIVEVIVSYVTTATTSILFKRGSLVQQGELGKETPFPLTFSSCV